MADNKRWTGGVICGLDPDGSHSGAQIGLICSGCGTDFVPSVLRFLVTLIALAGIVYGGAIALVTFVEPGTREISHTIPRDRLKVFRDQ
jgi:hypothetical protein